MVETSLTLFSNSTTSEVLYQVINALTMKYRGRCPRLVHLSADYAPRHWNNQHVSMLVKGKRSVHPPLRSRSQDSVQTMGEKAACLHDETSAFDHENNLDGNIKKKEIPERRGLPSMEDLLIKKKYRVDCTPHEYVTRQATKAMEAVFVTSRPTT